MTGLGDFSALGCALTYFLLADLLLLTCGAVYFAELHFSEEFSKQFHAQKMLLEFLKVVTKIFVFRGTDP